MARMSTDGTRMLPVPRTTAASAFMTQTEAAPRNNMFEGGGGSSTSPRPPLLVQQRPECEKEGAMQRAGHDADHQGVQGQRLCARMSSPRPGHD